MRVDDILLLRYVDGTLSPEEAHELERTMRDDATIAEQVKRLNASTVAYEKAFSAQALAPLPQHLADTVSALSERALRSNHMPGQASSTSRQDAPLANPHYGVHKLPPKRPWFRAPSGWTGFLATFCTGAIACALVLYVTGFKGKGNLDAPIPTAPSALTSVSIAMPQWVKAAAGYQQLFERQTVSDYQLTDARKAKALNAIRTQDQLPLLLPDLTAAGLDLKAILRLSYHGEPLIQIVYLPKSGAPIALCVMKAKQPDGNHTTQYKRLSVENMDVVTWQKAGLQYALIAAPGRDDLDVLAKDVASRPAA